MKARTTTWCLVAICGVLQVGEVRAAEPSAKSYYLIGNSLTWDTLPGLLDGDVQWHVDCGTSLPFVYANPDKPCVKSSTLWPTALKEKQYDVVSVQPHYGSTLQQDVETISAWMTMQPHAVFVIHSGWAHHATRAEEFASHDPLETMQHSPAYFRALLAELRRRHPGRELRQTRAINLLEQIAEDIAAKSVPFDNLTDLHRDAIHMKHESGKYLMHNAMRHALGQPMSAAGFEKMDVEVKQYLDGVLALLAVSPSDEQLLKQILSIAPAGRIQDRQRGSDGRGNPKVGRSEEPQKADVGRAQERFRGRCRATAASTARDDDRRQIVGHFESQKPGFLEKPGF